MKHKKSRKQEKETFMSHLTLTNLYQYLCNVLLKKLYSKYDIHNGCWFGSKLWIMFAWIISNMFPNAWIYIEVKIVDIYPFVI
jgi:hypothetical protein